MDEQEKKYQDLFTELTNYERSGVRMQMNGFPASPLQIVSAHMVPMFITTLSQTRMKSRFLAADEYISPRKSNVMTTLLLKPSMKIAHLRLSSPPYIMKAQRRRAR